jgi:hypothetical protein
MSTPEQRARWRAYSAQRYARKRVSIGRMVGDGIHAVVGGTEGKRKRNVNYVKRRKIEIGECTDCGLKCDEFTWPAFQWDHLLQNTKVEALSKMCKWASLEELNEEIAKCELVCAACHALRTHYWGHHRNVVEKKTHQEPNLFTIG